MFETFLKSQCAANKFDEENMINTIKGIGLCMLSIRVKSGKFGQSAKFGQQPCFFYFELLEYKLN